jgi:CRP/FNR family cyclic AMP-dependent transcriptional regulator
MHSATLMERQEAGVLVLSDTATLHTRKFNPLSHLTVAERERVLVRCTPRLAKRHSFIFRQGEKQKAIYIILSGGVRVFFAAPSGREITRAYWFPGHFIGGPDVFADAPHMWSAIAIRDTSLLTVPSAELRSLCAAIPNLAMGLIEAMVFKGRCYAAMTQMLGTRSASQRMTQVLMHLAELYGTETAEGTEIKLMLTQEEIAHMVGTTRQWVTLHLKRLQALDIVWFGRGYLLIRNAEALSRAA